MNTLQNMRTFVAVAECGTFSAAARKLRIGVATVSRNVKDLEASLSTRLLNRTTRQVALTDAELRYLRRCEHDWLLASPVLVALQLTAQCN